MILILPVGKKNKYIYKLEKCHQKMLTFGQRERYLDKRKTYFMLANNLEVRKYS